MTRIRRAALAVLAVLAAAAIPVPAAAARPAPATSYLGATNGGGVVMLGVGHGAHRLTFFKLRDAPGDCMGEPSRESQDGIPLPISARGRFHGGFVDSTALKVRGRLLPGGRARGTYDYFDRGDCSAQGPWRARVETRATGRGPRVFTLAGDGKDRHARGRPGGAVATDAVGLSPLPAGALAIADPGGTGNAFIRRAAANGRLTDLAGDGVPGDSGDGGPATEARIDYSQDVDRAADGSLLIADTANACIRRVAPDGTIDTVAGRCDDGGASAGFSGDGGPATAAHLDYPAGVAARPGGGFVIADLGNDRVREVSPSGVITTIAGTGVAGFSGDGGPATAAQLNRPNDVAVAADGSVLIADEDNGRVRSVSPGGTIATVAGGGTPSLRGGLGDGGPATAATVLDPTAVAARPGGGFLLADGGLGRIRRIAADGTIDTILGGGPLAGDGVTARDAALHFPVGVAMTSDGALTWSDAFDGIVGIEAPRRGTSRLLVATRPAAKRARAGRRTRLRVVSTQPARVVITITKRHGGVIRRPHRRIRPGTTRLRLPALGAGRWRVAVTARHAGRVAADHTALTVR